MNIEEALKWAEDPSGEFISDMDEQCIRVLAAEVKQLRIERDEAKKQHGYTCHICGALRRECDIMKRTSDDVTRRTAERCREIAVDQILAPPGAWGKGATFNAEKIARLIKEEYGLSD